MLTFLLLPPSPLSRFYFFFFRVYHSYSSEPISPVSHVNFFFLSFFPILPVSPFDGAVRAAERTYPSAGRSAPLPRSSLSRRPITRETGHPERRRKRPEQNSRFTLLRVRESRIAYKWARQQFPRRPMHLPSPYPDAERPRITLDITNIHDRFNRTLVFGIRLRAPSVLFYFLCHSFLFYFCSCFRFSLFSLLTL